MDTLSPTGLPTVVNTVSAGDQVSPAVAALTNGDYVIVWQDSSSHSVVGQLFDTDGGRLGGEFVVNPTPLAIDAHPKVAGLTGGGFVVAYGDQSGAQPEIFTHTYDASGASVGSGEMPGMGLFALAPLAGGGFVVASQNGAQAADAMGALAGPPVSGFNQADPLVAPAVTGLQDGGYLVLWPGQTKETTAALELTHVTAADATVLQNPVVLAPGASLTLLPDGDVVAAGIDYTGEFDVISPVTGNALFFGRLAQPDGDYLIPEGDQAIATSAPMTAVLGNGEIVAAISSLQGQGDHSAVNAALFGPNADPTITVLSSTGTVPVSPIVSQTDQVLGGIASLPGDRVVLVWQAASAPGDPAGSEIESRILSVGGSSPSILEAAGSILQIHGSGDPGWDQVQQLDANVSSGATSYADGIASLVRQATATTSVANLSYDYFLGSTPTSAGLAYLVDPQGPNPDNLNSAYYQHFNTDNRYINFAVNLALGSVDADGFKSSFGPLSLTDATSEAYQEIFGTAPTADKVSHILNDLVPDGLGGSYARSSYFASYGGDGPDGIGAKAAMIGWLLSQAAIEDVGSLARSNDAYLTDVAVNGAHVGVPLLAYNDPHFALIGS